MITLTQPSYTPKKWDLSGLQGMTWKKNLAAVGAMRGVGCAIAFQDPWTGRISFMLDDKPADRSKYIESFFANIDWATVAGRLK